MLAQLQLQLQDVERFSSMFRGYDILARRFAPYSCIQPLAELLAEVLTGAGALMWKSIPVSLFIGGVGAISGFKAVHIDKRERKRACAGGATNVPLGLVSLTQTLMMIAMALWMLVRHDCGVGAAEPPSIALTSPSPMESSPCRRALSA